MASVTKITKTVTLGVGEKFTLPKGATVTSVTGALSTTCNLDLPDPSPYVTYNFEFAINEDDNDDHPVAGSVNISSLLINGVEVPLTFTQMNTDNIGNSSGINQWNSEIGTNNTIISNYPIQFLSISADYANSSKSDLVYVEVKMLESYKDLVFLKIFTPNFLNGLYLKAFE
jgi:hypothetical protein